MRRIFTAILSAIVFMGSYIPIVALAETIEMEMTSNAMQNDREKMIMDLLDERRLRLREKNLSKVEEINYLLEELGVEFLTDQDVAEQFPDAVESLNEQYRKIDNTMSLTTGMEPPESNINTWSTFRTSNYLYNGKRYNIQRLIADPLVEDESVLWDEDSVTVKFTVDWEAGKTNFLSAAASVGFSELAPITSTVYDMLSAGWTGLKKVSKIDPGDVVYWWENETNVVFSYVRLESETDDNQRLSLVSSKCITTVGYIADIDSWSQNGDGVWTPYPDLVTGVKTINTTPTEYYSITAACQAYENGVTAANACIRRIKLSGPESKIIVNLYPCVPEFPLQCE